MNLVSIAAGFNCLFDIDVSFRKYGYSLAAEELLPYTMSQMYKSSFKESKAFLKTYAQYTLYAAFSGAIIYYFYKWGIMEPGAIIGEDGK